MMRKLCTVEWETKAAGDGPDVVARISTATLDRDGDVMLPSGIRTEAYRKNPVVLLQHDQNRPIGKAVNIRTTSRGITADMVFAKRPETHPEQVEWMPDTVKSLMQQGVLSAFSVGFIVPDGGMRAANAKDIERFGDGLQRVITEWELTEFSVVSVPANRDALASAVAKGVVPDGPTVKALRCGEPVVLRVPGGVGKARLSLDGRPTFKVG
jgi:HK97 family phage prohead protease